MGGVECGNSTERVLLHSQIHEILGDIKVEGYAKKQRCIGR